MKFKEYKEYNKLNKDNKKGFLEQYNDKAIERIMQENNNLYNSIKENKLFKNEIQKIYELLKKKVNQNYPKQKMKKVAMIFFSAFFIEGCTVKVDGILEVPNIIEYYSKIEYYDTLAKIKKACNGDEKEKLSFCKEYKIKGSDIVESVDKSIWKDVYLKNVDIEKEFNKLSEADKKYIEEIGIAYSDFNFVNEYEFENTLEESELHLGNRGDCSTFAVTFYQVLYEKGLVSDKVNLMIGTVKYNNEDSDEKHMWITVKINNKIIFIIDNNGIGILGKDYDDGDVYVDNFNLNIESGGGKVKANYTPETIIKN